MSLTPPPSFEYLEQDEREALEDAFLDAGVDYDRTTRKRLMDGVNRRYVYDYLPKRNDPGDQLFEDLSRMNSIPRLVDGTVPLGQWLRNAVRKFNTLPQRKLFEDALIKVAGQGETTGEAIEPAAAPPTEFQEIDTDGIDDLQSISFLSLGVSRLPAVAKLLVPRCQNKKLMMMPDGVNPQYGVGTGWLLAKDLLMTNYHVIRNRHQAEPSPSDEDLQCQVLGTYAQFFYDDDEQPGTKVKIKELVAAGKEKTKDFALLRLEQKMNISVLPLADEKVQLAQPQPTPKGTAVKALAVNIIQHPGGGPKRVALRNNLVYAADYPTLHYFTDTLSGSSGSPVFDDTWRVVALHRAAVQRTAELNGKILGYVNEGIQIHSILAQLGVQAAQDAGVAAAVQQIKDEQAAYT